jgi:biotin-dependent carboxylase-like uncharacterized protein
VSRFLVVLDPGPLTTVQDRGRAGWAHLGVPRAGALDGPAAALANRLVGNSVAAAVLETTLGGVSLQASTAMTLAVTGADAPVTVDGRSVAAREPVAVRSGQTLCVGPARTGLRSYVAAAGGIDVPAVLGSRSTDTLSGMGPAPLTKDQELPVGDPLGDPRGVDVSVVRPLVPPTLLRFRPGPRADWFTDEALEALTRSTYAVSSDSNRVGVRLNGPGLDRHRTGELPSEGLVLGAIQVPASGEPLVFLNDHPTTGGYPVVGVVAAGDLPACAQLRPGDEVRFTTRR